MIFKAYKYRLYPTSKQKILLSKHFGAVRWMYNYALDKKTKTYQTEGKNLSRFQIQSDLPELKKTDDFSWLKEINSQSLQAGLEDLDKAFTAFFRKQNSYPKFKSKRYNHHSFRVPQNTCVDFDNNRVSFPKFKEGMKCKLSRLFEGKIKSSVVSLTASGKYYISILVEQSNPEKVRTEICFDTTLGVDLGLKDFAIFSDGEKIPNPKHLQKSLSKLKRVQEKLSKKEKGSNNRNKQRIKVARIHEKITNQRNDFLHKLSTKLIAENQTIALEDLNVKGMSSSAKGSIEQPGRMVKQKSGLNRSIISASWSKFVNYLDYKAQWQGNNIIKIGRFEPSSRLCVCGELNKELKLSDRIWTCESCNTKHDRDILAANNIKMFALIKENKIPKDIRKSMPYRYGLALAKAGGESPMALA